jgi:hypothetical protein
MKIPSLITMLLTSSLVMVIGCNKKQPAPATNVQQQSPDVAVAHGASAVAGIHWTRPEQWGVQPPRQMRIATYSIPAAEGDDEGGECAVFYFGSGQGGDLNANIERWASQFENAGSAEQSPREVNGLKVTLVRIAGTYLAPSGPMMQSQGKKENYRLLGAIVDAPEGMVFFKLTGPKKGVAACESDFNSLVDSFSKQ